MGDEDTIQIKSLKKIHTCSRDYKLGSLVTSEWVGAKLKERIAHGIATGQLLSIVGRDANNQVYPLAWAVVDVETIDNWTWFVNLLKNHLNLSNGEEVAIISDQHMTKDQQHEVGLFRAGFDRNAVENGISECWNSMIKDARAKRIIGMLEDIRIKVLTRLVHQRTVSEMWNHEVCPTIRLKIQTNEILQRKWIVWASGIQQFEVRTTVSGIPCPHAIETQYHVGNDVASLVSKNLKKSKFIATSEPLPPIQKRMHDRPSVKRKRSTNLNEATGLVRSTRSGKCNNCYQYGHDRVSCTNPPLPLSEPVVNKKVRPRVINQTRCNILNWA
ncbi:uncharacterized protein [Rutidosis leptorrhynchoides]|uniref:uncharacterized protein n=1 Tax=Rutidosis leptorrhynchoides TaxID=125765 RepID=UPI003A9A3752